jgi:catechol 2,3-dioxygenase-like lactoylglutathione lyase family enzyme
MIEESKEFGARVAQHLREETVVWLTTVTPSGAPLPRPGGFLWDGGDILVLSGTAEVDESGPSAAEKGASSQSSRLSKHRPVRSLLLPINPAATSHACGTSFLGDERDAHRLTLRRVDEEVIPVLYVENAARAVAWYGRLGFHKQWEHQFEPGFPWFVSVARARVRLYLSEHKGDARPNTLIHLNVADIDAVAEEFGIAVDEEGLAGRECDLEDPDGNRLRVATPRS